MKISQIVDLVPVLYSFIVVNIIDINASFSVFLLAVLQSIYLYFIDGVDWVFFICG